MSDHPPVISPGLIARVRNILLKPAQEWDVIKVEGGDVKSLFMGYAAILAAIGPICALIGGQIFGYGGLLGTWRPDLIAAAGHAIAAYVMSLVGVYALGLIIDYLAPRFGGRADPLSAMKVAVYSSTASWVVGVIGLMPALAMLGILALYGLYLLYLGLPRLMQAPQDKAPVYTLVTVAAAIVIFIIVGWIGSLVMSGLGGGPGGAVTLP